MRAHDSFWPEKSLLLPAVQIHPEVRGQKYHQSIPWLHSAQEVQKSRIWKMSDKFCVTIKLSRWRAKIVTSLLPTPALLAHVFRRAMARTGKSAEFFLLRLNFLNMARGAKSHRFKYMY
jgi:hypothetical protein